MVGQPARCRVGVRRTGPPVRPPPAGARPRPRGRVQLRRPGDVPRGRTGHLLPVRQRVGQPDARHVRRAFPGRPRRRVVRRVGAEARRVARQRPDGRGLGARRPPPAPAGRARGVGAREGAADCDVAVRLPDDARLRARPAPRPARRRHLDLLPAPRHPDGCPCGARCPRGCVPGRDGRREQRQPGDDPESIRQGNAGVLQVRRRPGRRLAVRAHPDRPPGVGRRHRPGRADRRRRLPDRPGQVPAAGGLPPRLAGGERLEPLPGLRRPVEPVDGGRVRRPDHRSPGVRRPRDHIRPFRDDGADAGRLARHRRPDVGRDAAGLVDQPVRRLDPRRPRGRLRQQRDDQTLRAGAAQFAGLYDADLVARHYWAQALDTLREPREVPPLPDAKVFA